MGKSLTNYFGKIKISDFKLFVFPILLIVMYEAYSIHVYKNINSPHPIYPSWGANYVLILSPISAFVASVFSDKCGRKPLLIFCLFIAFFIFLLIHFKQETMALIISPLFFSTPIARAALIDNHEHLSVKNLMCFSYIAIFIPWSFLPQISFETEHPYLNLLFVICLISAFFFIDKLKNSRKEIKEIPMVKTKLGSLLISLLFAQIIFFLIVDRISLTGQEDKLKLFTFLGLGSLIGSILCFFSKERHEDLITLSFSFLLLLTFGSFLIFFYWGGISWESSLGLSGILGGFYLPVVTERAATILGRKNRGLACGLIELIIAIASLLALTFPEKLFPDAVFIITLVIFSVIAYSIQRYHSKLIRNSIK